MAMTNLLWIQEKFGPGTELYDQVVEIAMKWNAAVELIRTAPEEESRSPKQEALANAPAGFVDRNSEDYNGGIEEDHAEPPAENGGLKETLDQLASIGRSGGGRIVYGDPHQLVSTLSRTVPYTLVVVGDIFLSKGHAARQRAVRDFQGFLSEHIKAPVVTANELESRYLFGKRDIMRTAALILVTIFLYYMVFTRQEQILAFLAYSGWYAEAVENTFLSRFNWMPRIIVSLAVFLFVPIVAYSYATVTSTFLKLIKME